jgi:hypothetical protein
VKDSFVRWIERSVARCYNGALRAHRPAERPIPPKVNCRTGAPGPFHIAYFLYNGTSGG